MNSNFKLLEQMRLSGQIQANFACEYSQDGRISILTTSGVYILTLKGYMENPFPRFSFRKDFIKPSTSYITQFLGIDLPKFSAELCRSSLYEAVLDDVGVAFNAGKIPSPLKSLWSPRGIVGGIECALAIGTSFHCLNIYVKVIDEGEVIRYVCVVNVLQQITNHYKQVWTNSDHLSSEAKLNEIRNRANCVVISAFTFSHLMILKNKEPFCILFLGHKNGKVSIWKLEHIKLNNDSDVNLIFLGDYQTQLGHITALYWKKRRKLGGALCVGDSQGKISALYIKKLTETPLIFDDEVIFCKDNDFKVEKILIFNYSTINYFIAVKQNYLIIYGIDSLGKVFDVEYLNIGNVCITELYHYEGNCLITMDLCGQMKKIKLSVDNESVLVDQESLPQVYDRNKYRNHGFVYSPNKVFFGFLLFPCKIKDFPKAKHYVYFPIYANRERDPFNILMNEPTESLRNYWDCFETLRVLCIHESRFPWIGIDPDINYDTLSLLELKTLRWISKLSETVYKFVPKIPHYNIKAYVLLNYAVDIKLAVRRMRKLLDIHFTNGNCLTLFQFRSLDLLNFFLKEMMAKDILIKTNLGNTFIDEIYEVMRIANELEYPEMMQCTWCGEKIIGTTCLPFHMDSRCAISLMPISLVPGFKCPFCKCVVSKEIEEEFSPVFCPYCDIPMDIRDFNKSDVAHRDEEVKSDCFDDCLNEKTELDIDEISDNAFEYVILTDSEEDETEIMDLHKRIRQMVISQKKPVVKEDEENIVISSKSNSKPVSSDEDYNEDDQDDDEDYDF